MEPKVILVDEQDNAIGVMDKLQVHKEGLLHRAFSIFLFNEAGAMLIHKRAADKYHSENLWTNACCSHPQPEESVLEAAHRRLMEEMGMTCDLSFAFKFIYQTEVTQDLIEHELDHVLIGHTEAIPEPNPAEVQDWKWMHLEDLQADVNLHPENYTIWFKIALPHVVAHLNQ